MSTNANTRDESWRRMSRWRPSRLSRRDALATFLVLLVSHTSCKDTKADAKADAKAARDVTKAAKQIAKENKAFDRAAKKAARIAKLEAKLTALKNPVGAKAIKANKQPSKATVSVFA